VLNYTKGGKMKYNILSVGIFATIICGYVNGEVITSGEEVARVGNYTISVDEFKKQYRPKAEQNVDSLKEVTLDKLIGEKLMLIDAYTQGYLKDVEQELEKFKNRLTVGKLYERAVVERAKISPWEVRKWWWKLGTEVKLSEMIVKDTSEIKNIYKELREGKDFIEVTREYSRCSSCGKVKQVKWGEMAPELEKVAFSLNPGEVSRPIYRGNSCYILKVYGRIKVEKPEFAKEKEKIEGRLSGKKQSNLSTGYLEHLRKIAHPRYNIKIIEKLVKSPDTVAGNEVIMNWTGGKFTVSDFLEETERGGAIGQFTTVESIKTWILNKLTYDILLPIEASRHGLDRMPDIKKQLKEREEMLLMRKYNTEEIDGKVSVTDEECRDYYKKYPDKYKAKFEQIKSRVEWDIKREKKEKREEEVIKNLRDRINVVVYEENLKEIE